MIIISESAGCKVNTIQPANTYFQARKDLQRFAIFPHKPCMYDNAGGSLCSLFY